MAAITLKTKLSAAQAAEIDGFKVRPPKPAERRYTFSVQKVYHADGKRRQRDFDVPEVEAINRRLKAGEISEAAAEKAVAAIASGLRAQLVELKRAALYAAEPELGPIVETPSLPPASDRVSHLPLIALKMPEGATLSIPTGAEASTPKVDVPREIFEIKRAELENVVSFQFRAPSGKHKKFRLLKYVRNASDELCSMTLSIRAVDTINKSYVADRAANDPRALKKALEKGELLKRQLEARCEAQVK